MNCTVTSKISSESSTVKIIENDFLSLADLESLFNGEINAIRIPNYYRDESKKANGSYFSKSNSLECYDHELKTGESIEYLDYGVDRFGVSFNTTYNDCPDAKDRYYNNVVKNIRTIRDVFSGELSPFDKFRLELDEIWTGPVSIANFENKKLMSGIVRVMNRPNDSELISAQPHVDLLPLKYAKLAGQFAVNIYLSVPENGGHLELWDSPVVEHHKADDECAGDWRGRLNDSTYIKPESGDLIIFNSRVPHAVSQFSNGPRVSIQSFIGLSPNRELQLWS